MSLSQRGFSLPEVLVTMAISSVMLLSASRFLPGLQRATFMQTERQELEDEVWQRVSGIGKQLQRAGYCAATCQGQALSIAQQGACVIVQWDANSNGRWDNAPATDADQTGFRLQADSLETLRGATSCEGKGWEKMTDPDRLLVQRFVVSKTTRPGFAPELTVELVAAMKNRAETPFGARYSVTGFNL